MSGGYRDLKVYQLAYRLKRRYEKMFVSKMADADGEGTETQVFLAFARDCEYLPAKRCQELTLGSEEVGRMLGGMMDYPEKFAPRRPGR